MPAQPFPPTYDEDEYVVWHESNFPADAPLREKLTGLRNGLKDTMRTHLEPIGQLLSQIAVRTESEVAIKYNGLLRGRFSLPLQQLTSDESANYDELFKSVPSIIDKIWRKNRIQWDTDPVTIDSVTDTITDLVRASIVAPTLQHASEFGLRIKNWQHVFTKEEMEEHYSSIASINVDPEAKLESGYFAYHTLIFLNELPPIEIQIYSALTNTWREVSHSIYERTRLGEVLHQAPGTPAARFVSLGHLLHLAEVEFERILDELVRSQIVL